MNGNGWMPGGERKHIKKKLQHALENGQQWRFVIFDLIDWLICVDKSVQHVSSFSLICPCFKRSVNEQHWAMFWLTAQIHFLAYPDVI